MERIKNFLDKDGIVISWPSKRNKKDAVLGYLSTKFEKDRIYSEKEINNILNEWHSFNDAPLLRRELFDMRYLDRERDCSKYWLKEKEKKMTEYKLVEYEPKLAKAVADMWNRSKDGWEGREFNKNEDTVKNYESTSSHLSLDLAMDGGKVIGYSKLAKYFADKDTLYLDLLSVDPAYHGKKVGKMLVKKSVERTIGLGYPRLDLFTWPGNIKAVPLYKKCGFFWEKMEANATHLMNFIPAVLNTELLKDYFRTADWYDDSTRAIEIAPDGRSENDFDYLTYSWSKNGRDLSVEFEKTGRGIRKVACNDYIITATVERPRLVFGQKYKIRYEIENLSGKALNVEIKGINDRNIVSESAFKKNIKGKEIFEGEFFVDSIETDQSAWNTHPGVVSEIKVNGKKVVFKTGICPQFPLKFKLSGGYNLVHSGIENDLFVNIENNYPEECTFDIALKNTYEIRFINKKNRIKLAAGEKSSIALKTVLKNSVVYYEDAEITAAFKNGKKYSFRQKFSLPVNTYEGRSAGENDRYYYMNFGKFSFSLDKHLDYNEMIYRSISSGQWSYIGMPKIGKPYTSEFQRKAPYKSKIVKTDASTLLKLFYNSSDHPGCGFTQNYELFRNGMMKHWIEVVSFPKGRDEFSVSYNMIIDRSLMNLHYDGKLIKTNGKKFHDTSLEYWDGKKIDENWLYCENKRGNLALIWPKNFKPAVASWSFVMESTFKKGGKLKTEPVYFAIDVFSSVSRVREFALGVDRIDPEKIYNSFDLEVNGGNPFVSGKTECAYAELKNKPVKAEVTISSPYRSFKKISKKVTAEDKLYRAGGEISFNGKRRIEMIDALVDNNSRAIRMLKAVFVKKDGKIIFKKVKAGDHTVHSVTNGPVELKTSPEFTSGIFSMTFEGREWLDSGFPKKEPKSWFNPWTGGTTHKPNSMKNYDWNEEKAEVRQVTKTDNYGNKWKGFEISTLVEKYKPLKGVVYRQYFLMMPELPVVALYSIVEQNSGSHLNEVMDMQTFLKAGSSVKQAVLSYEKDGRDIITRCGVEEMDEDTERFLVTCSSDTERKEILHQYASSKGAFWATSNPSVAYTDVIEDRKIKNGDTKVFSPKFFIFSEDKLPEESLFDLQNVRFKK